MVEIAEECATNKDFVFETLEKQLSFLDWLKSLPERFNLQPKLEWSEEDEHRRQQAINALDRNGYYVLVDWLKSLRHQPHWKPSKKQIDALNSIILIGSFTYVGQGQDLISLKDDLKKLM